MPNHNLTLNRLCFFAVMKFAYFLQALVLLLLAFYFASKMIAAVNKLEARKVGTVISDKFEETVQGHSQCYHN